MINNGNNGRVKNFIKALNVSRGKEYMEFCLNLKMAKIKKKVIIMSL